MLPSADLFPTLLPITIVAVGAMVTLVSETFLPVAKKHQVLPWIAAIFLTAAGASLGSVHSGVYMGIVAVDPTRLALLATLLLCALLGLSGLGLQQGRDRFPGGEAYSLMLLSLCGSMLMVQATDLLALFLGMELSAIPVYALVGLQRKSLEANEGIFKYFVYGALFGAVFLYGAALWYGATGSTSLTALTLPGREKLQLIGFALVVLALFFKAGAAPLHAWVADVYQGASIPVTAFMASTVKIGAIASIAAVWLGVQLPGSPLDLGAQHFAPGYAFAGPVANLVLIVGLLSIAVGAFAGLAPTRARRMLGFSAVANAGFMLLAFLVPGDAGAGSIALGSLWLYLVSYALASALALAGISALAAGSEEGDDQLNALTGRGRANPVVGVLVTLALVSLAGLPPVIGFLAKFSVLAGLFAGGHPWAAAAAIAMAVVAASYYLRLAYVLWQKADEEVACTSLPGLLKFALGLAGLALLALNLVPNLIIRL